MVSATDTNTMGDANQHQNLDHGETSFFSKVWQSKLRLFVFIHLKAHSTSTERWYVGKTEWSVEENTECIMTCWKSRGNERAKNFTFTRTSH